MRAVSSSRNNTSEWGNLIEFSVFLVSLEDYVVYPVGMTHMLFLIIGFNLRSGESAAILL